MRPDEIAHVVADSGAALTLHRPRRPADGGRPLGRRGRRPSPTTSPRSSTRRAPPASRRASSSPTGPARRHGRRRRCCPAASATTRRWSACRSPTSWGSPSALGLACAGIPVCFLPEFNPVRVLDAIESRRASLFVGVPAMYRMLLEAGAEERDLQVGAGVGVGRRRHAGRPGRPVQEDGRHRELPVVGAVGRGRLRRGLRHGRDRRRGGGQVLAAAARPRASARRWAWRCPATRSRWSTTTATRCAAGRSASCW